MKQCLYNNTFIIHTFQFEVVSSLIQANYGCHTLETGKRKHAWREEHSQRHSKQLQRQCNLQQVALDNTEACLCSCMGLISTVYFAPITFHFTFQQQVWLKKNNENFTVTSMTNDIILESYLRQGNYITRTRARETWLKQHNKHQEVIWGNICFIMRVMTICTQVITIN